MTSDLCPKHGKPLLRFKGKTLNECADCERSAYFEAVGHPQVLNWQEINETYAFIPKGMPVLIWCEIYGPVVATLADPSIWTQYPPPEFQDTLKPRYWTPVPKPTQVK